ncbi:M20/M25/M40 family metallo-hydrolase [Roseisolibacter agri]|nr:M20/M25/M40 family metallo-hydrolase [Roseisolibacter agri]
MPLLSSAPTAASDVARVHDALARARARLVARDAVTVRDQVTLAEIPAPTGEEEERGAWVARRFRALGLADVRVDAAGNVVGRRPGEDRSEDAPRVAVCAHLDTVFPRETPLQVRHEGRRLVGPGIGDNGRGLTAMLALAETFDGVQLRTRHAIEFVATTGEEGLGDLRGAKRYFAETPNVVAAVALDGAGDERIVHRAVGSRRFRVTFAGPGGHSWAAFGVPNAVHAAARAAAAIAALPLDDSPRVTVSVGRIGGGICVNAIPADAWLEVDLRSTSGAMLDRYEQSIRRAVHGAAYEENVIRAEGTPALTMRVEVIGDRPGGELAAEAPLVAGAVAMTRLVGRVPELGAASTDANVPLGRGVPAIAIGAGGRGGDAHTPAEWFENAEGAVGLARALGIVALAAELVGAA